MHALNASKPARPLPRDPLLWLVTALVAAVATGLAVLRYVGYNASMLDLGNMFQAIMSVLRGEPLVVTAFYGNVSRLAGHVELLYYAFVPFVAIWPDPRVLLIGQALLASLGAIPAYRLALRRLDSVLAARCAALIYLFYPVAQTAVLFDFHGDTLAMPLLMFALDAADRRAWRSFAGWALLALLCKVYIAVPVAAIGGYLLLWGGQRRAGLLIGVAAFLYGALAFFGIRGLFAGYSEAAPAVNYVEHYYGGLAELGDSWLPRLLNLLIVFGPPMLIAWRGWRWLLCGAPLALAVLLSTGPGGSYHYTYHHYATVVPFIVMAVIDGAARLRARAAAAPAGAKVRRWRPDLVFTTVVVVLACALLVDQPLNPRFWSRGYSGGLDSSAYGITSRDAVKDAFLAAHAPPAGAPAAISTFLAPHLANREVLYMVRYNDDPGGERLATLLPQLDHVLSDALFDWRRVNGEEVYGGQPYERAEIALLLSEPAFGLTAARDGLLHFERAAPEERRLGNEVAVVAASDLPEQTLYFGPIRLLGAAITPLGGRRYEARFAWTATEPIEQGLLPVSSLAGVPDARMVHLPTYALLPTSEWRPGEVISERFEIELPPDLAAGSYSWQVAWFDPRHPDAHETDSRSLLPGSAPAVVATIEVHE
jgi:uncharacterized membrane protein